MAKIRELTKTGIGIQFGNYAIGPRPDEATLALAYLKMLQSGHLSKVWHQSGGIDLRSYLDELQDKKLLLLGAWDIRDQTFHGAGFINKYNSMSGFTRAEVGFMFMPDSDASIFVKIGMIQAMIEYVFSFTDIDSLTGVTPDMNAPAVALIKRAGMSLFGPVPNYTVYDGKPCGVWISQADKASWLNRT